MDFRGATATAASAPEPSPRSPGAAGRVLRVAASPRPTAPSPSAASRPDPARPRPATPGRLHPRDPRRRRPPGARIRAHASRGARRRRRHHAVGRDPGRRRRDGRRAPRGRRPRRASHALGERAAGAPAEPARGSSRRRRGAVTVRWRASDADGDRLVATVQYSANRGRSWRTVHLGGSTGGVRLAARELAPSRRAQIRVRVDDGFDEAVATSRAFTVLAAAPQARILEPVRGARVREGAPVILRAEASAAGRPLAGRALRWFDRRRALGRASADTAAPRRRPTHDPSRRHRGRPAHRPHRRHLRGRRQTGVPRALRAPPPEPARPHRAAARRHHRDGDPDRRRPALSRRPAGAHADHPDPPRKPSAAPSARAPWRRRPHPTRSPSPAGDADITPRVARPLAARRASRTAGPCDEGAA